MKEEKRKKGEKKKLGGVGNKKKENWKKNK